MQINFVHKIKLDNPFEHISIFVILKSFFIVWKMYSEPNLQHWMGYIDFTHIEVQGLNKLGFGRMSVIP